jgi:hypothetical protein
MDAIRLFDRITAEDSCIYVHTVGISLKATKAFTHGSVTFDLTARTLGFGKALPVTVPENLTVEDGSVLHFQLVAPDGSLRKQVRTGVLRANKTAPNILRIAGMAKTASKFSSTDGWGIEIYKYRAYFTHTGLNTDTEIPEWLKQSIARQRAYWNRLAWLCRDARCKCSPVPAEEIAAFVRDSILPAIDSFNNSMVRAHTKENMRYPSKLKLEMPSLDAVWGFVGELRKRIGKNKAVPLGLMEKTIAFAEQFKADYTPLKEFIQDFDTIAAREAKNLNLCRYEIRPTIQAFKAALNRRKTLKSAWMEGWPAIKYTDSPRAADWGVYFYFNKAGVKSELLESGNGVPGLTFSSPLSPSKTGQPNMTSPRRTARALREAEISVVGINSERYVFRFGVLQHRPLPVDSHLKQWSLIYSDGALWLCLTVELQRPLAAHGIQAAGLDIGWRRRGDCIQFGTLYEPASETIRELIIDLQKNPANHEGRTPFNIDLGPCRWDKRNITKLFPNWKPGDVIPNTIETRAALAVRRSGYNDTAKMLLHKHLGDQIPAWVDKAGSRGLLKLKEEFRDDPVVHSIVDDYRKKSGALNSIVSMYIERYTERLKYGQIQIAHDVCRYLQSKGITRLIVETGFIAKIAKIHNNDDSESLKQSQKYRQFAAVGRFIAELNNIAVKYGIKVDKHDAINTTRICQYCNHLNPSMNKERYFCEKCGRKIRKGDNAAINLSRFGSDPELAEMALHPGKD